MNKPDGINDPNVQEWLAHHGVEVDDEGIPQGVGTSGPSKICDLCGAVAEAPVACLLSNGAGDSINMIRCQDCYRLSFVDSKESWRRIHAAFPQLSNSGE